MQNVIVLLIQQHHSRQLLFLKPQSYLFLPQSNHAFLFEGLYIFFYLSLLVCGGISYGVLLVSVCTQESMAEDRSPHQRQNPGLVYYPGIHYIRLTLPQGCLAGRVVGAKIGPASISYLKMRHGIQVRLVIHGLIAQHSVMPSASSLVDHNRFTN